MLLMPQVILVEYDPRVKAILISKILQRYDKKCTYASKRVIILQKDRLIYLIYPSAAIGSLLTDGCRWEYDRVLTIFENNYESLEYGQHFANVLSRWAREYTNEVGALEVLQKYIPSPSPYPFFGGNPPRRGRGVPKKCISPAEKMYIKVGSCKSLTIYQSFRNYVAYT